MDVRELVGIIDSVLRSKKKDSRPYKAGGSIRHGEPLGRPYTSDSQDGEDDPVHESTALFYNTNLLILDESFNKDGLERDIEIRPRLEKINPKKIIAMHGYDASFKDGLAEKIKREGYDSKYPILVVKTKIGYLVLDGHHRGHASKQIGLKSIPAYVIDHRELSALLNARFKGKMPNNMKKFDRFIFVKGRTYDKYRAKNAHSNNSGTLAGSGTSSGTSSGATSR